MTDDGVESWDVLECLGSWSRNRWSSPRTPTRRTTRYRLLETLRASSRASASTRPATPTAGGVATPSTTPPSANTPVPAWKAPTSSPGQRRVEAELDNIRAVLRWGTDTTAQADADLALRIVIALTILESFTTTWSTQLWADALIPRARSSSIAGRSGVIAAAAFWHMLQDDLEGAERLAREALESPTGPGASRFIAISYQVLGRGALSPARPGRRARTRGRGSPRARRGRCPIERPRSAAPTVASLFCLSVGDLDGARREADVFVEIARATGNPSRISLARGAEGRAWSSEDPDRALAAFDESIALARAGASGACTPARSPVPPNCVLEPATDSVPFPNCGPPSRSVTTSASESTSG